MKMLETEPLISIGLPTYNRPALLRRALGSVSRQKYENLEIIVSDNCSDTGETEAVVREFMEKDNRIIFFKQEENKGGEFNFRFVLSKASGNFFMWIADDYWIEDEYYVKKLYEASKSNVLVFPDINLFFSDGKKHYNLLKSIYGNCRSKMDYLLCFCRVGYGYPIYGLFNIIEFKNNNLEFIFDKDLYNHNDVTLLHKIFINGKVEFVSNALINVDHGNNIYNDYLYFESYLECIRRVFVLYLKCNLSINNKLLIYNTILDSFGNRFFCLAKSSLKFDKRKTYLFLIKNPLAVILILRYKFCRFFLKR